MGRYFALIVFLFLFVCCPAFGQNNSKSDSGNNTLPTVSLIFDGTPGPAARHGMEKLRLALKTKGVPFDEPADVAAARGKSLIVAGLTNGPGPAATVGATWKATTPPKPESLLIRAGTWNGKKTILLAGADDRGLMYALLDAADRIGWADDPAKPLSQISDTVESPDVADRALAIYTMHRGQFESRLFDENYWNRYFDMLARNRFNSFVLIFGYETSGYLAPAYPYFLDVDGFPDVRVVDQTNEKQEQNRKALTRLIQIAHEHGIRFTAGLWDIIYRGGVQGPVELANKPTPGLVWGLNEKNLTAYTVGALGTFLKTFPDVDAIQFRMHEESGLKSSEIKDYWEQIYQVMKRAPQVRMDCRLKGYGDDLIDRAVELGLNFRLVTKFWAEHMGLPYSPTHIQPWNQFDRRHSYADVLRYPQKYKMQWQLWTGGTVRMLLWGDPEYVRRFDGATHLYDGDGFEVVEPLATKMASHHDIEKPFDLLNPRYRYYDYEFERYWHFFQVFGRLGYNPQTPTEVWDREFQRRIGKEAGPFVEKALHRSSQILPRIEAYCMPQGRFATTRGWTEKQRLEDLPDYAAAQPSDTQQFEGMIAAAANILEDKDSPKNSPQQTSHWFAGAANDVLELVAEAEKRSEPKPGTEYFSTIVDLKMLAHLAAYHSHRAMAGLNFALFQLSHDLNALDDAISAEKLAIAEWEKIVAAAGDVYAENLMFGRPWVDQAGHWKDELTALKKGLGTLELQRNEFHPEPEATVAKYDFGSGPVKEGFDRLKKQAIFTRPMPNGSYMLKFTIEGDAKPCGPMWIEANGIDYCEPFLVPPGQSIEKSLETTVVDGKLSVVMRAATSASWNVSTMTVIERGPKIAHIPIRKTQPGADVAIRATIGGDVPLASAVLVYGSARGGFTRTAMQLAGQNLYRGVIPGDKVQPGLTYWIESADTHAGRGRSQQVDCIVSTDDDPPAVVHQPVTRAPAGKPLVISAEVRDPSGVKWVRVRYRSVNQFQDFRTLEMLPTGQGDVYRAEIPGDHIPPKWDFMYFIEVMDKAGNGKIFPDIEKETPYVVVGLER